MPPNLKFLRLPGSSSERDLQIIDKSIQFAQSNKIDVIIINDTDEVKTLIAETTVVDQSIYVCMPFEGKIFEKLKVKGYRLIGPQCVISCLLIEMAVPRQTYPICNIAMLGTVVCCSSMKKEERVSIQELVLRMGGQVTGDFTQNVTHLVAKEVGSKKYEVACTRKIPTLFPSWIHSAWEASKYDHFVATESTVIKEHLIPIFKGCTICVTGIDAAKREAIKTMVQKNGGVYSGELNMKTCTHLLVEHPHGQKYNHARQWKLHCVLPTWLYECLKKKHWISEKPYKVEPDNNATNTSILQTSKIQNTILVANNRLSSITSEITKNKNINKKDNDNNKESKLKFKTVLQESIDISDFKLGKSNSYLEECKIYICNRPGPLYDICKKIINNGGGIRLNSLGESITHLVVWDAIQSDISIFLNGIKESNGMFPHVVSPLWLIDCCKNGNMMDEEDYSLVETLEDIKILDDGVFEMPKVPVSKSAVTSALQKQLEDDIADESVLMNQYLTANHESTRISQLEMMDEKKENTNFDDVTQDDDTTATLDEISTSILEKKKFAIQRFDSNQVTQIINLIEEYGGEVVKDGKDSDYIIVPVSHETEISINLKEVTLCWLEQSIEQQQLKDPKSCYLFKPIHLPDNVKPLQNCVVTISQYTGIERQHLFHLAELLGGVGQEYFVRNDQSTMKASTHLILSRPEGSKYDASVKWKIPCVDKEWLFRCAHTKRRLPEEAFSLAIKKDPVKDDEFELTIEETNAHAWEHREEETIAPDKSIIAEPPNDVTDHLSLDFSTRGASLIDNTSKKEVTELKPDSPNPNPAQHSDLDLDQTPVNTQIKKKDLSGVKDLETINDVTKSPNVSNDFSAFNALIASKKRDDLEDKENDCESPKFPSSLPNFDRSRFSFDFSDALDGFQSPVVSSQDSRRKSTSRRSRASLPFDIQFTEALQKAVNVHCGDDDEVFKKYKDKYNEDNVAGEDAILKGVVVVVSKKLSHSQTELHNLATELGGDIRFMYDDSCTHFIHQGRINDTSKDYVEAKKNKKFLVSPSWLRACVDSRVNEKQYPVNYNPRMSIEMASTESASCTIVKENTCSSSSSTEETDVDKNNKAITRAMEPLPPKDLANVQKKMEEIMNAAKVPRNERRTRRQTCNTSINKSDNCSRKMRSRTSSQKNDSAQSSNSDPQVSKTPAVEDFQNEQSQGGLITYDDPTGRLERERILEHLKRASPSQDIESLYYPVEKLGCVGNGSTKVAPSVKVDKENETVDKQVRNDDLSQSEPKKSLSPYKPQISLPITNASAKPEVIDLLYDQEAEDELKKIENAKKYKFIFSGMNGQEKIDYGATIEELGGVLFDMQYFNMQSTHLIVKAPSKNEKYLASLASGRWALHKSFLDASREANDFVSELDHEWGCQPDASELAIAARRWRVELTEKRLSDPHAGAFVGWVVLLCIETSKQAGFKRILEAGGARLLALRPPFDNIQGATHAFIGDRKQMMKAKVDLRVLHDAGIWILKPEYIADYLIFNPKPRTFDYVLDEVNSFEEQSEDTSQRKRKASVASKAQKKTKR